MAGQDSKGDGLSGYQRSLQTVGRQRRGRARYRLLLTLSILAICGFAFKYLLASRLGGGPAWYLYFLPVSMGGFLSALIYLVRFLGKESRRLDKLEDREAQISLFADRHDIATRTNGLEVSVNAKQEAADFGKMMERLETHDSSTAGSQDPGEESDDVQRGVREVAANGIAIARQAHILVRTVLPASKSPELPARTDPRPGLPEPTLDDPPNKDD